MRSWCRSSAWRAHSARSRASFDCASFVCIPCTCTLMRRWKYSSPLSYAWVMRSSGTVVHDRMCGYVRDALPDRLGLRKRFGPAGHMNYILDAMTHVRRVVRTSLKRAFAASISCSGVPNGSLSTTTVSTTVHRTPPLHVHLDVSVVLELCTPCALHAGSSVSDGRS